MSVLPHSASFASFFVVLAVFLLFTILFGANLPNFIAKTSPFFQNPSLLFCRPKTAGIAGLWRGDMPPWVKDYIESYIYLLDRFRGNSIWKLLVGQPLKYPKARLLRWPLFAFYATVLLLTRLIPAIILRHFAVPEILYPHFQWILFKYRHHYALEHKIKRYKILIFTDIVRFALVPAWIVLALVVLCNLVLQDLVVWIFKLIVKVLRSEDDAVSLTATSEYDSECRRAQQPVRKLITGKLLAHTDAQVSSHRFTQDLRAGSFGGGIWGLFYLFTEDISQVVKGFCLMV